MSTASAHTRQPIDQRTEHAPLARSLSRRALVGRGLAAGAALGAGTVILGTASAHDGGAEDTLVVTTAALNLRTGPGTGYRVILVMPKGVQVTLQRRYQNGFDNVSYKGQLGWASRAYLIPATGGYPTDPVIIGSARTTAAVNLRSGPSTSNQVLRVVAAGATVQISDTVRTGFRYVIHNGLAGWIADQYLSPSSGGETLTTTARLNLRAEPSVSARVLLVIPSGAAVQAGTQGSGQFRQVTYRGTTGWAATAYLN